MMNKKGVWTGTGMSRNPDHFFISVAYGKVLQAKIDYDRSSFNSVEAFKS